MSEARQPVDQIQYWNETAGPKWVRYQEVLDAQIRPLGLAAMDRAAVRPGERALDVGCGCGDTTIELAERVGADGRVLGVDVSAPMLEVAAKRIAAIGLKHASVERGDATVHRLERGAFDLLFSRFGVMFFPDPTKAFGNLHGALRSGGRLAFICWQPLDRNPWVLMPLMAAAQHVPLPAPPGPEDPGPFSFASPDRVRRILEAAGFSNVAIDPHETDFDLLRGGTMDQAVEFILQIGPISTVLKDRTEEEVRRVTTAIREAIQPFELPEGGVRSSAACWIVRATA
jgi:SAM-dependent methyltransferase